MFTNLVKKKFVLFIAISISLTLHPRQAGRVISADVHHDSNVRQLCDCIQRCDRRSIAVHFQLTNGR